MQELKQQYTIVIVTHNMQQAARVSDRTAFFTAELDSETDRRTGAARRVRPHREDLLQPVRRAHRELHHRAVRLSRDRDARRTLPPTSSTRSTTRSTASAALLVETVPRATEVLLTSDLRGADELIHGDDVFDERCIDLEERCYALLALQAPVAGRPPPRSSPP